VCSGNTRAFQVRREAFEAIAKETKMAGEIGWGLSDEIDCTSGRGNPHRNPRPAKLDPVRGCFVRGQRKLPNLRNNRGSRLFNGDRGELCTVHPREGDRVAPNQ
jgi:hypothetical protein